jgi:hypothetical protein
MRFGKNTTHKKTAADWGGGHSTQFSKILNNQGDVILPATTNAIRPVAEAIAVAEGAFPRIGRYRNSDRLAIARPSALEAPPPVSLQRNQTKKKARIAPGSSLPIVVVAIVATSIVARAIVVIRIRSTTIIPVPRAIVTVVVGIGCRCRA